jgi:diguanylate cyclase (GGDEF)-like protein
MGQGQRGGAAVARPADLPEVAEGAPDVAMALVRLAHDPQDAAARALKAAFPATPLEVRGSGVDAVAQTIAARHRGRDVAIIAFDFTGAPLTEMRQHLRNAAKASPDAELIVFAYADDCGVLPAALEAGPPDRLTFLLDAHDNPQAERVIRALADRVRARRAARAAARDQDHVIRRLEAEALEVQARLDVAMHAARHDSLTRLPNRAGFAGELASRLANGFQSQTVFLINIDRFKLVNETLGHEAGDDLIRKIGVALQSAMPPGGLLARLGGDEFGIVTESLTEQGVDAFCQRLLRVCAQSRRVYGHEVQVSVCIGVCVQKPGQDNGDVLRQADLALRAAKREGRNRWRAWDDEIASSSSRRLSLESGLERALRAGEFRMVYQPIVGARSLEILGYEGLVRWNSPEFGEVSPADFIPVAEDTGLMLELGDWIMRQALKDCRRWGGPYVSINLSARQFLYQKIGERVLQYASDSDLPASRVQIELTETAIIDDVQRAAENLRVLREAGVRVALDDFGTGYSSLTYLHRFAIDCIKIDRSFVEAVTRDRQAAMIVASVTKLAKTLGMTVTAEGVETEPQRQILLAAGCDYLQGFHFGRPIPPGDVIAVRRDES